MSKTIEQLFETISVIHKEKGERWIDDFDKLVEYCKQRWSLTFHSPFSLSYNYVAPATSNDGRELVVKLAVPSEEFLAEVEALSLLHGVVKMIDVDTDKGIIILERCQPGTTLASLDNDEAATTIAAKVLNELWAPVPKKTSLPSTIERQRSLETIHAKTKEGLDLITKETIQLALTIFKRLNRTTSERYLLHGDFHHYNVLETDNSNWLAIDPKGLIGDREYDCIQFLLNKFPTNNNMEERTSRRIEILVNECHLNEERILLWGYAHTVLATCWTVEEQGIVDSTFYQMIDVFKKLYKRKYGELSN